MSEEIIIQIGDFHYLWLWMQKIQITNLAMV